MSEHAIGIMIGVLLGVLILAVVLLHLKEREGRRMQAEMEDYIRRMKNHDPNAWDSVPRRYKR